MVIIRKSSEINDSNMDATKAPNSVDQGAQAKNYFAFHGGGYAEASTALLGLAQPACPDHAFCQTADLQLAPVVLVLQGVRGLRDVQHDVVHRHKTAPPAITTSLFAQSSDKIRSSIHLKGHGRNARNDQTPGPA